MILKNKNILVIGGSGGLGLAACLVFLQEGANVFASGLGPPEALPVSSSNFTYLVSDAANEDAVDRLVKEALTRLPQIHGLYHIAGGSGRKAGDGPLHLMSLEGWDYTLNLNLKSIMLSNRAIIRYWMDNHLPGVILNMGSVLASSPSAQYFSTHAYAAAKAGVEGFSRSLAAYYARSNIRVNVIAPGLIETGMSTRAQEDPAIRAFIKTKQPLDGGRMGKPADCAGTAAFLLSDLSSFISGEVIHVDGGWQLSDGQYYTK
ncbi:MAG TPA: SDR family oxidoreductase [Saprospiraceae bacterium]|nr:SDR family oxidoreductase [Saprospiraceae bacterium]HNT19747.1 SDR family oxidoreductase [Saprospiraceae bacterium]